jgi:hypothetical protein
MQWHEGLLVCRTAYAATICYDTLHLPSPPIKLPPTYLPATNINTVHTTTALPPFIHPIAADTFHV